MNNGTTIVRAVRAFERVFACHICLHDYTGELGKAAPEIPHYHLNPTCTALKYKKPELHGICAFFDRNSVQRYLSGKNGPFVKLCHCGLLEVVIPVFIESKLAGVLFCGPFRVSSTALSPIHLNAGTSKWSVASVSGKLPEMDGAKMENIMALGMMLAQRLETLVKESRTDAVFGGRTERIENFFAANFSKNISREDLAASLHLSVSRTSQLLNELFHCGFSDMLLKYRLEHAVHLLKNTCFKLETVALNSGFTEPGYFFRVFRKQFGVTPGEYRSKLNRELPENRKFLA